MKNARYRALIIATIVCSCFAHTCLAQPISGKGVIKVNLVSRLEFAPELFDQIRKSLVEKFNAPCSLVFQPVDEIASFAASHKHCHLLVENGIKEDLLPPGFTKTNDYIDLVWLLAVRGKALAQIAAETLNTRQFLEILAELKKRYPHKFPWFEPLCSKITLRNFCLLFTETMAPAKENNSAPMPLWLENSAIAFLYRSIEGGYLNPLSVEADATLVASAFSAGDADFATCWVPLEVLLKQDWLEKDWLEKKSPRVFFMPFPAQDGAGIVPRIRLNLWRCGHDSHGFGSENQAALSVASYSFVDLDFAADMDWINGNFTDRYDSLIMGDF